LILAILAQADGKVGYSISVTVNDSNASTSWGRSHFTSVFDFNSESHTKGDGNSTQYAKISGLTGVSLLETTHTKEGRLKEDKRLSAISSVNSIAIDESVSNNAEKYSVTINESMPSYLISVSEVQYRGEGINKRSNYINNDDEIMTRYQAKKFSESTAFLAKYRNALIVADVTPNEIVEFIGENYSTVLQTSSNSDMYSGFKMRSSNEFIDQDYFGQFKINRRVEKSHSFAKQDADDLESLLDCCPSEYASLDYSLQAARLCLCRSALSGLDNGMK
jgi:hypothetical protein